MEHGINVMQLSICQAGHAVTNPKQNRDAYLDEAKVIHMCHHGVGYGVGSSVKQGFAITNLEEGELKQYVL